MDNILMISGSREISQKMAIYLHEQLARAVEKNYFILVGDNPEGVDMLVLNLLETWEYPKLSICSPGQADPRSVAKLNGIPYLVKSKADYTYRDQEMCHIADKGIFVWNSKSSGTKAAYDYMVSLGKEAHLVTFPKGKAKVQSHFTG